MLLNKSSLQLFPNQIKAFIFEESLVITISNYNG